MPTNLYTGQVQGASLIATGTPSAFCREILGGSLKFNEHNIRKQGAGGQLHVRRGTREVDLELKCVGALKTYTQKFFPTTAGVIVAAFSDMLIEADDGSGGQEFVLSNGVPASCSIELGDSLDGEVEYTFASKWAVATPQAAGTKIPVYNAFAGHTRSDVTILWGAVAFGVWGFTLSNDLGADTFDPADGKVAGSHVLPNGVYFTKQDIKLAITGSNALYPAVADVWTPANFTCVCANGTVGENQTITGVNFVPEDWSMPVETDGGVKFAHAFAPGDGTIYNRVTVA